MTIKNFPATSISENYGRTVSVICRGSGKPQPTLLWYKNGSAATDANINVVFSVIDNTTVQSVITIQALTNKNAGLYQCVGMNILPNGSVSHSQSFVLNVIGGLCKFLLYYV